MKSRVSKKKKQEIIPGTIVKCESGRFLAYYEHRTDIIANGENEKDAKKNLKIMYDIITKQEASEEEKPSLVLPPEYITKPFTEKMDCI